MNRYRRFAPVLFAAVFAVLLADGRAIGAEEKVIMYVRFEVDDTVAYGIVESERVRRIAGDVFGSWKPTDETYGLSEVKLLAPTQPTTVLAVAGNYKSHLGDAPGREHPEMFFKVPSCLIAAGESIVIPKGTADVHYEAELVIVIGKRTKDVPEDRALDHVLGVTCGNDVSARDWQEKDVQWWRAKGSDTFGPCGPWVVSGINYDDVLLELRLNGELKQQERTSYMRHGVAALVSWASRHVTLEPGDLIFTGTPGKTSAIKPGDVVEVELEGVGILKNPVRAAE